ncbi:MAG: M6 family metalloprotease domain-containing protein [Bacteroidetes bacterium]|nr:M6 family metalloprotease domain-containing protein [Bacteroidota bacterium]
MKTILFFKVLCLYVLLLLAPVISSAALLRDVPQTIILPDSSVIQCFSSGDEFFNWLHDENGFTLIFDSDGFLYYFIKDGDLLKPSKYRINSVDPESVGIQPGNIISGEAYQQIRKDYSKYGYSGNSSKTPHTGVINNLVVYIRFSGDSEYTDLTTYFDDMFNSVLPNANSMKNYYAEASYNQLTIHSTFYPTTTGSTVISYQDSHERNYYRPYNATSNPNGYQGGEKWEREHTLIKAATVSIASQVPPGLNIDGDNDGNIDGICFIMRGGTDNWGNILWPHAASTGEPFTYINGKKLCTYTIQLQTNLYTRGNGILCHEMFHVIGAPDLYHYDNTYSGLQPVNKWDIMGNDQNPPQHMSAYMKATYGLWLPSTPIISATGYYTLNPLNSAMNSNVCFRINSPNTAYEYFIVEYRKKTGTFEQSLPGEGMVIYRINSSFSGNAGYNDSTVFDEIYAYRPGGSTTVNGTPDNANYSQLVGRTAINCSTDPTPYLSQGGAGGLDIREITDNNGTLTFLLLYDIPAYIVLNQPDTWGLWAAINEIQLQDGFSTTPSNSLRTLITEPCPSKGYESLPYFEFLEVNITDQTNQKVGLFTIQSEVGSGFNVDAISNRPDDMGNILPPGEYRFTVKKGGTEIEKGNMIIE